MPTYEYRCAACGAELEIFQSITEAPKRKCPRCGERKLARKIGAGAGFLFRGSGFYQTDYRSESYRKAEAGEPQASQGAADRQAEQGAADRQAARGAADRQAERGAADRPAARGAADRAEGSAGGKPSKAEPGAKPQPTAEGHPKPRGDAKGKRKAE